MFYSLTKQLYTNYSTSLCQSEHFTIPKNTYSSPYLSPKIHDLSLQPQLQHCILFLIPSLLLKNLTLKITPKSFPLISNISTTFFWNLLTNMTSKMQNWTMLKLTRRSKKSTSHANPNNRSFVQTEWNLSA